MVYGVLIQTPSQFPQAIVRNSQKKLNVYIYNHSNSTIYIGRTYGLLMQVDGEWKYIAKGRNQKCITIWPASKRNFQVSLCAKKIKSSSGWAYRTDSLYKVRFDVYDSDGIFY